MAIADDFQKATEDVKKLSSRPSNTDLLQLYGLYKQATEGDNRSSQPWAVQIEARAKWDAWSAHKGTSKDDAMKKYVEVVKRLGGS